jgi:hypothetical protein
MTQTAANQLMPYLNLQIDEQALFRDLGEKERKLSQLVKRGFVDELNLVIYLTIDNEMTIARVSADLLEGWGVDADYAFGIAFENLNKRTRPENISFISDGSGRELLHAVFYDSGKDGFDATRILLPSLRSELCRKLKTDQCYIGIPNRDFLIAFVPDPQVQAIFREQIKKDFQRFDHPVSDRLFGADIQGNLWLIK